MGGLTPTSIYYGETTAEWRSDSKGYQLWDGPKVTVYGMDSNGLRFRLSQKWPWKDLNPAYLRKRLPIMGWAKGNHLWEDCSK